MNKSFNLEDAKFRLKAAHHSQVQLIKSLRQYSVNSTPTNDLSIKLGSLLDSGNSESNSFCAIEFGTTKTTPQVVTNLREELNNLKLSSKEEIIKLHKQILDLTSANSSLRAKLLEAQANINQ